MPRILVVDDSDVIAVWLAAILVANGFDVTTVTYDQGRLLDPTDPRWTGVDVLFCDLMMPDVDGLQILQAAAVDHPHIYRVAFTGAESELLEHGHELAHEVLRKPTGTDRILTAARRAKG